MRHKADKDKRDIAVDNICNQLTKGRPAEDRALRRLLINLCNKGFKLGEARQQAKDYDAWEDGYNTGLDCIN